MPFSKSAIGTIGAVLIVAAIAAAIFWFAARPDSASPEATSATPAPPVSKRHIVEYKVEAGDTWEKITKKFAIDWNLGLAILASSEGAHSLASIHEGNQIRFFYENAMAELDAIEYDIDDEELLLVSANGMGEFSAEIKEIVYDVNIAVKQGTIESFLYETALAQGIPESIVLDLAWIFSWDIDFASSIQKGDSFVVVYEERYRDGEKVKPGNILAARFVNSGNTFEAFYYTDPEGYSGYYNAGGRQLRRQFLRSPLDYTRITSGFSYNRFHPILQTFGTHRAIDYAAAAGTPVSATADGTVTYAGWSGGNGNYVGMKHANGYSTGYAHLSAFAKGIKYGAKIKQNQVIGFVGSTGLSTGPHLHYEMRKNGALINPLRLDLPPGDMMKEESLEGFWEKRDGLLEMY